MRSFNAPFPAQISQELQDEIFAMSLCLDMMRRQPDQSQNWVHQFDRAYRRMQTILDDLRG